MLDENDVDLAVVSGMGAVGAFGIVFVVLAIIISIIVYDNKNECAQKKCDFGHPELVNHDCYCVEKAK